MLTYRVLGPLQVERDGHDVTVSAAKPRAVLLALLLNAGAVVSSDLLIEALWPGDAPPSAAKLLQVYVSQLRGLLGADAIETVSPGYRMPVDAEGTDADGFERLHTEAAHALAEGHPQLAVSLATRALALWRGPALADFAFAPFADRAASRLEQLREQCVEVRLDALLANGEHDAAYADLVALCREQPLHERHRERLVLTLYRSARQAEALEMIRETRRVLLDKLGLDPGPGLRALEQAILEQDPSLVVGTDQSTGGSALPMPASTMVGRQAEVAALLALLDRESARIVTLSGAGGSGKTRVALEVARRAAGTLASGSVVVELASVRDADLVLPAIARELHVVESATVDAADAVIAALRGREVLLILDNFEHVLPAGVAVANLVRELPRLTVLVTSRRVLHVAGEHVYPLGPLPADDAVALFRVRAQERGPSADVSDEAVLRAICARVDYLPLAVELAAARTATLAPSQLLTRLTTSVAALGVGPRDAPARQQTLSDTVAWSVGLLDDGERSALARSSVFAGAFTLEAAEDVCAVDLTSIAGLVDASLLQRTSVGEQSRFSMLETIREHAAALLLVSGRDAVEQAHGDYFAAFAENTPTKGAAEEHGLQRLDAEIDDLRVAHDRAVARRDYTTALRIATALSHYWYCRGLFREGRDRIGVPLERGGGTADVELRARALCALAGMHFLLGDDDFADATAASGVALGLEGGRPEPVIGCHTVRGLIAVRRRDFDTARVEIEQSSALATLHGLEADVIVANTNLAEIALAAGDLDEARRRWEHTLERNRRSGEGHDTFALLGLGEVARRQGRLDDAAGHFRSARLMAEQLGSPHSVVIAVLGEASVASQRGEAEEAGRLLGRVSSLAASTTGELHGVEADNYQATAEDVAAAVGADRFAELLEEGRAPARSGQ